ncbi:YdbC family protein [Metabacillus endolithicus]|uniref:YdbC family protein n=1 Tax=Metabacillus endolithicus TaxID=1535204 RepID=A0ABW5BUK1_9BACI|nr:PC4/YdbC family ssDNA-binding protein [Metabacillus endolithicus]UPG63452.1 PC4/YdbC family ssDNA-binding protein [Metabacillus endolithicus]
MANIKFDIQQNLGIISEGAKGWKKEFNLISWNGRDPKYDIRDWDEQHEKMGKGVTLSKEEIIQLREILNGIEL